MDKIRLAIVGATGMAGREAVLHQDHLKRNGENYAELVMVTGSERTAGRELGEVFDERERELSGAYGYWKPQRCPDRFKDREVRETDPESIAEKADYVISALPSAVAERVEPELRKRNVHVFSNAGRYRWEENVPLMIPEVNPSHIQRTRDQGTGGKQVNNPNCTTAGFVPVLHALLEGGYSLKRVHVDTKQSISGKGGKVRGQDYQSHIKGNVIDDWDDAGEGRNGEEMKSEIEPQKILGNGRRKEEVLSGYRDIRTGKVRPRESNLVPVFVNTNRVPTQYGHLETLSLEFEDGVRAREVRDLLENCDVPEEIRDLPSTPESLFMVKEDKPEPREDVFEGDGMATVVGRVRQVTPREISLYTLSHNLRKGATWTARHSMELYLREFEGRF